MFKSDTVIGVALILLSAFFFINSYSITQSTISAPMADASFFPRVISALLAISSFVLIIRDRITKQKTKKAEQEKSEGDEGETDTGTSEKYVFYMMGATTVYIFLIPVIGYLVSTILYMSVSCLYLGSSYVKRKKLTVLIALAISLFAYFLFGTILSVFLPQGILL